MFAIVMCLVLYFDYLKFCAVYINGQRYVCCSKHYIYVVTDGGYELVGGQKIFLLLVHQPVVPSLQWVLSTNPRVTTCCICGCFGCTGEGTMLQYEGEVAEIRSHLSWVCEISSAVGMLFFVNLTMQYIYYRCIVHVPIGLDFPVMDIFFVSLKFCHIRFYTL